jgi:ABC-type Na+ efflux pump permease subunit
MIEAIIRQELLLGSRRTRLHVFRWVYAGWLIVQVGWFWLLFTMMERDRIFNLQVAQFQNPMLVIHHSSSPSVIGGWFCEMFVPQQLILLLLAIPPLVCGAIADEKRRGTLSYLLTTDLDTRHILLGKLIGRMIQVLALMAAGLPLFALFAGYAGIQLVPLLLLGLTLLPPLFALASASILASVVCRQTRDAVLAVYILGGIGFGLSWIVPGLTVSFDPRWVVAPVWGGVSDATLSLFGQRFLLGLALWASVGLGCIALALAWLRPIYRRELENEGQRLTWYSVERAPMTVNPVAWRERQVEGLTPFTGFKSMPLWLACALVALVTTLSSITILIFSMPPGVTAGDFLRAVVFVNFSRLATLLPGAALGFLGQGIVVLLIATFIVGVRTSGAITSEREKFTWEALLITPLSEGDLVRGKLWGVLSSSSWYLLAYAAPALSLSILGGMLAFLWTLLWLAVTLLAMYFIGAAGLWASARSGTSSWRSLLSTMGFGYLGGVLIFVVTSPVIAILAVIIMAMLFVADSILGTQMAAVAVRGLNTYWTLFFVATCIGLAIIFFIAASLFVRNAQTWIATRDRTRHWDEEPIYRLARRRISDRSLAARFGDPE